MIEFDKALAKAQAHYRKSNEVVTKAWDHPDYRIFYGDANNGLTKIGGQSISVSKETGEIKTVYLPSAEGFAIFDAATPHKLK